MARIVLAEDELHILHLVGLWLRRNGHEVIETRDGQAALQAVKQHRPDALITDVSMPGLDGLTLVRQALSAERRPRAIIILSSRADLQEFEAEHAGLNVRRHPKPFSPSKLLADLESALNVGVSGLTPSELTGAPDAEVRV
jgi:CheY-like chemotaxis protein